MEFEAQILPLAKQGSRPRFDRKFKLATCLLLLFAYLLYYFAFPQPTVTCINDAYHNFTLQANRALVQSPGPAFEGNSNQLTTWGKAFIGTGQVLMDLWIGVLGTLWLFRIRNLRAMAAIALFYLIRGIIFLNLEKFPYPENLAWRSPSFLSVTVPYDHTRDFFFSGHCGGLSIVTAEMFHLQLTKTGVLALLSLLYMANMLLTTEVHYSIDILAGILFALWFYRLAIRYVVYFDKLFSLPQVGWNKLLELLRKEEDEGSATSSQNEEKIVESNEQLKKEAAINKDALNEEIEA